MFRKILIVAAWVVVIGILIAILVPFCEPCPREATRRVASQNNLHQIWVAFACDAVGAGGTFRAVQTSTRRANRS